jgi:hypothetical protein
VSILQNLYCKTNNELIIPATTGMKVPGCYDHHSTARRSAIHAIRGRVDDACLEKGDDGTVECLHERVRARPFAKRERHAWRYILVTAPLTRR